MILAHAEFWVGLCVSSLIISVTYTYFFFKPLVNKVDKIYESKSTYPEYEEYKRLLIEMPLVKGEYSTTFGQFYHHEKPYPDSEMSDDVRAGLIEHEERRELSDLISDRKETLSIIGVLSVIGLFYSIGAIILR